MIFRARMPGPAGRICAVRSLSASHVCPVDIRNGANELKALAEGTGVQHVERIVPHVHRKLDAACTQM